MKRVVIWDPSARSDIRSIVSYLISRNLDASKRVSAAIRACGNQLGDHSTGRPGRVDGTYEKSVIGLPYILAYAIDVLPNGDEHIVILHIIHTARDWQPNKWPR